MPTERTILAVREAHDFQDKHPDETGWFLCVSEKPTASILPIITRKSQVWQTGGPLPNTKRAVSDYAERRPLARNPGSVFRPATRAR